MVAFFKPGERPLVAVEKTGRDFGISAGTKIYVPENLMLRIIIIYREQMDIRPAGRNYWI